MLAREAMATELKGMRLGGRDRAVEVDGGFFVGNQLGAKITVGQITSNQVYTVATLVMVAATSVDWCADIGSARRETDKG